MDAIGRLRQRMSLQAETWTPDGAGGATSTWTETARVFAAIAGMDGTDGETAMREAARTRYRVSLRYRRDVAAGMRLVRGDRVLTIMATFDADGTRRRLTCLCAEEA